MRINTIETLKLNKDEEDILFSAFLILEEILEEIETDNITYQGNEISLNDIKKTYYTLEYFI